MGTEKRGPSLRALAGAADSIYRLHIGDISMRRWSFFVYGVFCHLLFLGAFAWMAGFVGNLLVPKSLDSTPANDLFAVGVDLCLIGLFGLQHSLMARPWFKRIWTRLVPQPIE